MQLMSVCLPLQMSRCHSPISMDYRGHTIHSYPHTSENTPSTHIQMKIEEPQHLYSQATAVSARLLLHWHPSFTFCPCFWCCKSKFYWTFFSNKYFAICKCLQIKTSITYTWPSVIAIVYNLIDDTGVTRLLLSIICWLSNIHLALSNEAKYVRLEPGLINCIAFC